MIKAVLTISSRGLSGHMAYHPCFSPNRADSECHDGLTLVLRFYFLRKRNIILSSSPVRLSPNIGQDFFLFDCEIKKYEDEARQRTGV